MLLSGRKIFAWVAFCLLLQPIFVFALIKEAAAHPAGSSAPVAPPGSGLVNLNLSSTQRTLPAGQLGFTNTVSINLSGVREVIHPTDFLTPGEYMAALQVLDTGRQTLQLGLLGNAVSGSLSLAPTQAPSVSGMLVPLGVTLLENLNSGKALTFAGDLTNEGKIVAYSSVSSVHSVSIDAANIYNLSSGLISSVTSISGNQVDLQLDAAGDLINNGAIYSSAHLSLVAGGTISNVSAAGEITIGSINAQGGSTSNSAKNGGSGGLILLAGASIQLTAASASGASINSTGGKNGAKVLSPGGPISIMSNGVQPFPVNFDVATTKQLEVALPGAMFELGNGKVNGSAGKLVSNDASGPEILSTGQRVIGSTLTAGNVSVQATNPVATILEGANPVLVFVTNGLGPKAPRTMLTPSEAVYLYDYQRIGFGPSLNSNGVLTASFANVITILNGADVHPFKSFNLNSEVTFPFSTPSLAIKLTDSEPSILMQMSGAAAPNISGIVTIGGAGVAEHQAIFQLGTAPLTITSTGKVNNFGSLRLTIESAKTVSVVNSGVVDLFDALSVQAPQSISITGADSSDFAGTDTVFSVGVGSHYGGTLSITGTTGANFGGNLFLYAGTINFGSNSPSGPTGPQIGALVSEVEAYGNANIFTCLGVDVSSHIYTLGSLAMFGGQGVSDSPTSTIDSQGSITVTSGFDVVTRGTWSAGQNISLIGANGVTDNAGAPQVTAEKGSLTLGSLGLGSISLTGTGDFTSQTTTSVFGIGNVPINLSGGILSQGSLSVGSQPALGVIYTGTITTAANAELVAFHGTLGMNTGGSIMLGQNAILLAGLPVAGSTLSNTPIQKSAITTAGNIDLEGAQGVTIGTDTTATTHIESIGGDLMIRSTLGGGLPGRSGRLCRLWWQLHCPR